MDVDVLFAQHVFCILGGSVRLDVANTAQAASKASDGRMQALAAGSAALTAYYSKGAVCALAKEGIANAGFCASITVGSSKSQSDTYQNSSTSRGSSVQAGGNVNLIATGVGQDGDILVQGSDITVGKDATLIADN